MLEPKIATRSRWWNYEDVFLILLLGIMLYMPGLGQVALFDRDEPRFASAARNMLETGNYIVPHFNGELRPDKPPLIYWLMTLTYQLVGVNELGARLPSALCGMLTPLVVYFAAGWRFGRVTGILAALMLGATSLFIIESRLATADSAMVLFTTIALACAWRAWEAAREKLSAEGIVPAPRSLVSDGSALDPAPQSARPTPTPLWVALLFWVALSLGTLAKGIPLLFVFLPMVVLSLLTGHGKQAYQNWRKWPFTSQILHFPQLLWQLVRAGNWRWWRQLRPGIGFPILIVLVGWWGVAVSVATHGEFLRQMLGIHFLNRAAGPLLSALGIKLSDIVGSTTQVNDPMKTYSYPPGFYLGLVWVTFWPWCFLIIPAAFHTLRRLRGRTAVAIDKRPYQFLLAWLVPMWIALECSRGKLLHYVLPLYIPLVILCADTLVQSWHRLSDVLAARWFQAAKWVWLTIWIVLAAGAYLVPGYLLSPKEAEVLSSLMLPLMGALIGCGVAGVIAWDRPSWPFITVLGYGVVLLLLNTIILPSLNELHLSKSLMTEARSWRDDHGFALGTIGYREPTLVFYSNRQILPMTDTVRLPQPAAENTAPTIKPEIAALFAPGPKHLRPLQSATPNPASFNELVRDPTQATMFIVDQSVLEDLDQAHIPYTVVQRLRGFRTDKLNDLKRQLASWFGASTRSSRQFNAILISNRNPFPPPPASQPATTSQPTTTSPAP